MKRDSCFRQQLAACMDSLTNSVIQHLIKMSDKGLSHARFFFMKTRLHRRKRMAMFQMFMGLGGTHSFGQSQVISRRTIYTFGFTSIYFLARRKRSTRRTLAHQKLETVRLSPALDIKAFLPYKNAKKKPLIYR